MTLNINIGPADAKGQKPVGVRHLVVSRFVYGDGSVRYRAMPLNKNDTPEDAIEIALNGLGLIIRTVEKYTDDHDGATMTNVRRIIKDLYEIDGYAAVWPREPEINMPEFLYGEPEKSEEIPPRVQQGEEGGEAAGGSAPAGV